MHIIHIITCVHKTLHVYTYLSLMKQKTSNGDLYNWAEIPATFSHASPTLPTPIHLGQGGRGFFS